MPLSPALLALLAAAALMGAACGRSPQPPSPAQESAAMTPEQLPFTRLVNASTSGFDEPAERVVRDPAALAEAWSTLHRRLPGDPVPEVDFSRHQVLVIALGPRSTGGYAVRFEGITRGEGGTVARYAATRPGPDCMSTQALTSPVEMVVVPRVEGEVRFERREVVEPC